MVFPWLQDALGKQPSDEAEFLALLPLHCPLSSSSWAGHSLLILQRCPQATAAPGSLITAWLPLGERRGDVSLPLCHKRQALSQQQVQQWQRQDLYDGTGNKWQQTALATFCSVMLVTFLLLHHERWTVGGKDPKQTQIQAKLLKNSIMECWAHGITADKFTIQRSKGINQLQIISGHENMFSNTLNLARIIFLTACLKEKWDIWLKEINPSPMPCCVISKK